MPDEDNKLNTSETKLADKLTSLKIIATDFERRITGWEQKGKGGDWEYTGKAMVGSETASRLTGLLQSFCNEINLISENDDYDVAWDKYNTVIAMLDSTLLDPFVNDNYKTVCVLFSNALKRIISVIKTSKGMFEKYFVNQEEKEESKGAVF